MPVLLTSEADWHTWLTGTPAEAFALLRPYPEGAMRHVGFGLERRDAGTEEGAAQQTLLL